jgi:hypothetical protein
MAGRGNDLVNTGQPTYAEVQTLGISRRTDFREFRDVTDRLLLDSLSV